MITTIIFDLSEVYLQGMIGVQLYLEPILKANGKEIYPKLLGETLDDLFRGKITEEGYWLKTIKKNNWSVGLELLKKTMRGNFKEIKGVREIIEKLKDKGFKLGLLSVHAKEWVDYCEKKYDYHKLFHSIIYSFEIGLRKPEKRIYKIILKKLGSKPEECIFIDDKSKNVDAAKEFGMKGIVFKNASQLEIELKNMGIL